MRKWMLLSVILVIVGVVACLYSFAGLKQYFRALIIVNQMSPEKKNIAWEEFTGSDNRGAIRGIFAGNWMGRVWLWTSKGLRSYAVDEYTIYSVFDGCSEDVKSKIKKGQADSIQRGLYINFDVWREKVNVGDYVALYLTKSENGGTEGNLREIYGYNFWLFMNTGIDIECAK